jgi:hypothetical protein
VNLGIHKTPGNAYGQHAIEKRGLETKKARPFQVRASFQYENLTVMLPEGNMTDQGATQQSAQLCEDAKSSSRGMVTPRFNPLSEMHPPQVHGSANFSCSTPVDLERDHRNRSPNKAIMRKAHGRRRVSRLKWGVVSENTQNKIIHTDS